MRGYFSAHPNVTWTREGAGLQTIEGIRTYPRSETITHVSKNNLSASDNERSTVWIDMFESIGMEYRFPRNERWQDDVMISFGDPGACVDMAPSNYFELIAEKLPRTKILVTIRNQRDWIISNYHHFARYLPEYRCGFDDFLSTVEGRMVLAAANFDRLVRSLFKVFGQKNVFVLPLEEIQHSCQGTLDALSKFLLLDPIDHVPLERDFNRGIDHGSATTREFIELERADGIGRVVIPAKSTLIRSHGAMLDAFYAVSNRRLEKLLGTDMGNLGYPK